MSVNATDNARTAAANRMPTIGFDTADWAQPPGTDTFPLKGSDILWAHLAHREPEE